VLDFHSHLIPGVDDGAATLDESRAALASMRAQGVRVVITTPHLRASLLARPDECAAYFELVDSAWEALRSMAVAEFPDMRIERGFEIMLDMPKPDLSDPRLRLAGSKFVLVEFPFSALPPNSAQALFDVKMAGYHPIVAHPERYVDMERELTTAAEWKRVGAALQVNAGSLVGAYGKKAESLAWRLIRAGMADYLSSDFHARGEPKVAEACDALLQAGGEEQHRLLATTNPEAILKNQLPQPVAPVREPVRGWRRFFSRG
jgi:protein-tyrosine phosphatase